VHVLFTETRGGTELAFTLDEALSNLSAADWEKGEGTVRLVGKLKFDEMPVRCVADIDVNTVEGTGHLEILEPAPAGSPRAVDHRRRKSATLWASKCQACGTPEVPSWNFGDLSASITTGSRKHA
jgi:hypothetical protein